MSEINDVGAIDPEKEGITHLNIGPSSIFLECRRLNPFYILKNIKSEFGFTYDSMIKPILYMKFEDPDIFMELMENRSPDARQVYKNHAANESLVSRKQRKAFMYLLYMERALKDKEFCDNLYKTGTYPLHMYKTVVTSHQDMHTHMVGARPIYLSEWLPAIVANVRRDLFEEEKIDVAPFLNLLHPNEHVLGTVPLYDDLEWDELQSKLSQILRALSNLAPAVVMRYNPSRSLDELDKFD